MKRKMLKVILGVMVIVSIFGNKTEVKEVSDTGNNVLKSGKVVEIEYAESDLEDKLYFEIEGYTYEVIDFAEDMFVGDDVLVCINTKGTENQKDDVIMMWRYWNPDVVER